MLSRHEFGEFWGGQAAFNLFRTYLDKLYIELLKDLIN